LAARTSIGRGLYPDGRSVAVDVRGDYRRLATGAVVIATTLELSRRRRRAG